MALAPKNKEINNELLINAIDKEDVDFIKKYLSEIFLTCYDFHHFLEIACSLNRDKSLECLLKLQPLAEVVDPYDDDIIDYYHLIKIAVSYGNLKVVSYLYDKAGLSSGTWESFFLDMAYNEDHEEVFEFLLKKGCSLKSFIEKRTSYHDNDGALFKWLHSPKNKKQYELGLEILNHIRKLGDELPCWFSLST